MKCCQKSPPRWIFSRSDDLLRARNNVVNDKGVGNSNSMGSRYTCVAYVRSKGLSIRRIKLRIQEHHFRVRVMRLLAGLLACLFTDHQIIISRRGWPPFTARECWLSAFGHDRDRRYGLMERPAWGGVDESAESADAKGLTITKRLCDM
jgi:hypothetical protein